MTDKQDIEKKPQDATAEIVVFDHIKIVENESAKEIVNKRG